MGRFTYPFQTRIQGVSDALLSALQSNFREAATEDWVTAAIAVVSSGLAAHLADTTDAHDASAISNVPAGNIVATTVQDAINELDTEKLSTTTAASTYVELAGDTMTGDLTVQKSSGTANVKAVNTAGAAVVQAVGTTTASVGVDISTASPLSAALSLNATSGAAALELCDDFGDRFRLTLSGTNATLGSGDGIDATAGTLRAATVAISDNSTKVATTAAVTSALTVTESGIIIPSSSNLQQAFAQVEQYVQNLEERFEQHIHDPTLYQSVACSVYSTAAVSLATATVTELTADSENYDDWGMHSTSSNTARITVPCGGLYLLTASVVFAASSSKTERLVGFDKNSSGLYYGVNESTCDGDGTDSFNVGASTVMRLNAGDYVRTSARQRTGVNLNATLSVFTVTKIG